MSHFRLFAARDGEVLHEQATHDSEAEARAWASRRIAANFNLLLDETDDFDSVAADCDGIILEESDCDPMDRLMLRWAEAQVGMLSAFQDHYRERFVAEREGCAAALMTLMAATRP